MYNKGLGGVRGHYCIFYTPKIKKFKCRGVWPYVDVRTYRVIDLGGLFTGRRVGVVECIVRG